MNYSDCSEPPQTTQPDDSTRVWSVASDWRLENSVEPGPDFELAFLVEAVDHEQALARELLALVLAQTPGEVLALERALGENDPGTIGRILHSQKASFEVFGLVAVVNLGRVIEQRLAAKKAVAAVSVLVGQYVRLLRAELGLMHVALQTALGGDLT